MRRIAIAILLSVLAGEAAADEVSVSVQAVTEYRSTGNSPFDVLHVQLEIRGNAGLLKTSKSLRAVLLRLGWCV